MQAAAIASMESTPDLPGPDTAATTVSGDGEGDAPKDPEPTFVDHPHLILAGSDITVLSAIDSQTKKRTRYKLHKAILSGFSSVMRDMFEASTDDSKPGGEAAEVILEDSATDLTRLFSFMYAHEEKVVFTTWDTLGRDIDEGMDAICTADKYGVASLQKTFEWNLKAELQTQSTHADNGDDIDEDLTFGALVRVLAYADRTSNQDLMDLAMEATSWYLKCSGQHLIDIDLEEFDDLTPLVERKLWQFHTKKDKDRLREVEKERTDLQSAKYRDLTAERTKRSNYIKAPVVAEHHKSSPCWVHIALPAYYAAIYKFLGRIETETVTAARSSLTSASYGTCSTCTSAINARIAEIPRS